MSVLLIIILIGGAFAIAVRFSKPSSPLIDPQTSLKPDKAPSKDN